MVTQNPVALAANTLRQLGESATQTITSVASQFTQVQSQLLRGLATGAGPFPLPLALPGVAGNPNGAPAGGLGIPGLPTLQQLLPVQAIQAIGQLENSILPPGVPRPSAVLLAGVVAAPTPAPTPTPTAPMNAAGTERASVPTSGPRRISQRSGM